MRTSDGIKNKNIRLDKFLYAEEYRPVFFTLITNFKKTYFTDDVLNVQIIENLKSVFNRQFSVLPVYCLMPDHLHFLVYLIDDNYNLLDVTNYFKSCSSKIGKKFGIETLWQKRYYDHIIRKKESLFEICKYIFDNPVRKGLVEQSVQYKYSEIIYDKISI